MIKQIVYCDLPEELVINNEPYEFKGVNSKHNYDSARAIHRKINSKWLI